MLLASSTMMHTSTGQVTQQVTRDDYCDCIIITTQHVCAAPTYTVKIVTMYSALMDITLSEPNVATDCEQKHVLAFQQAEVTQGCNYCM